MCPVRRAGIRCGDSTTDCLTAAGTRVAHFHQAKPPYQAVRRFAWWERVDSNHRSRRQQIYSLPPLATRERSHIRLSLLKEGGAGRRTRTPDLLITNQLLYQLSYTSTISSEVYVTRNVPICQPLNLFFWRFFILRIVRKRWRDLQRAWPAGLCPRCGMELYPGDLDWVLGGRRLCGACAAAWLAEEAERLAAGRKGAVE